MTGAEAWAILLAELDELYKYRASLFGTDRLFTNDEMSAQVTAFIALKQMDEQEEKKKVSE